MDTKFLDFIKKLKDFLDQNFLHHNVNQMKILSMFLIHQMMLLHKVNMNTKVQVFHEKITN